MLKLKRILELHDVTSDYNENAVATQINGIHAIFDYLFKFVDLSGKKETMELNVNKYKLSKFFLSKN